MVKICNNNTFSRNFDTQQMIYGTPSVWHPNFMWISKKKILFEGIFLLVIFVSPLYEFGFFYPVDRVENQI